MHEPSFEFYDRSLLDAARGVNAGPGGAEENSNVQEFFRLLALCHTVMPEEHNGMLISNRKLLCNTCRYAYNIGRAEY